MYSSLDFEKQIFYLFSHWVLSQSLAHENMTLKRLLLFGCLSTLAPLNPFMFMVKPATTLYVRQ